MKTKCLFLALFSLTVLVIPVHADDNSVDRGYLANVYIDCDNCDFDFVRSEITFVNYVIDRKDADIYILITSERRGGGGSRYTISFSGRNKLAGQESVLNFTTQENETEDNIRVQMVRTLKLGLIPFISNTPIADNINISYSVPAEAVVKIDRWNNWVFRTRVGGQLQGEKSAKGNAINASFAAERITNEWKVRMGAYVNYQEEVYQISDKSVVGISRIRQFQSMTVKSLSQRWSFGMGLEAGSSIYSNLRVRFLTYPAIEYNIFPYSESTRREFRIYYGAGLGYNRYEKETIYGKTRERLWGQRAGVVVESKQEWGRIEVEVEGMNYFQDMSKNRLRVSGDISLYIVRGLSLAFRGGISMIHDQLALPKGEASSQEILLRIRELETQYNYWFSMGFELTFGSIYNNIVNSRFGNRK